MVKNIAICDTTLRDGEQMPGVYFKPEEKIKLAIKIDEFGVDVIELMPAVSKTEQLVAKTLADAGLNAEIRALTRIKKEDIELATKLDIPRLLIWTPTSEIQLKSNIRKTREEVMIESAEAVDYAKEHGFKVDFGAEDASRTNPDFLKELVKPFKNKIEFYTIADTVGIFKPPECYNFFKELRKIKVPLEFHAHNDFGMATANTLLAIEAGASAFTGTFCGIGERAGNTPIEEVAAALYILEKRKLGLNFTILDEIKKMIEDFTEVKVQLHKPVIGDNVFRHKSGIHVNALLRNSRVYEVIDPGLLGRKTVLLFGKHSGLHSLERIINAEKEELKKFLHFLKEVSEQEKKDFSMEETKMLFDIWRKKT